MKKKKDGLKSKVMIFPLKKIPRTYDSKRYIPYCDLGCHRGLILDEDVCKNRRCEYYYKLPIEQLDKFK